MTSCRRVKRLRARYYCNSKPYEPHDLEGLLSVATEEQSRIGWDHFLTGRLSQRWGDIMHDKYSKIPALRKFESRNRFVMKVIDALWNLYGKLWAYRCGQRHDNTDLESLRLEALDKHWLLLQEKTGVIR